MGLSVTAEKALENWSQAERQSTEHKSYLKKTAEARQQIIHYETKYGSKFDLDHNMNI